MSFYTFVTSLNNKIIHVGYDDDGNKFTRSESFKPILATLTDKNQTHGYKTIQGKDVQFNKFNDINSYNKYLRDYSDIFELYNSIGPQFQFINRTYGDLSKIDKTQIRRFILDIEAHSEPGEGFPEPKIALWPIRSITIHDSKTDNYFLISTGPWGKTADILTKRGMDLSKIQFKQCKSELELFETLVKIFEGCRPDIISGYNSDGFDIPYILNRAAMIDFVGIKRLSPFGMTNVEWKELDNGRTQYKCRILGIALLDYMTMYKKYRSANRESYRLDFLLNLEIKQKKVDFHEQGYDTFSALWNGNPDLYNTYNIYDVGGMIEMEKKLHLFDLHYVRTYRAKCNFENALGTITYWDVFMYNYLWNQKIIIPPNKRNVRESYPGAYVKQPTPGIYKYIFSVDLNSLYPHIMQQWNISPECLIETENIQNKCYYDELVDVKEQNMLMRDMKFFAEDIAEFFNHRGETEDGMARVQGLHPDFLNGKIFGNRDYILAPNGVYFSRDKEGFVSILMKELYNERQIIKKQQLKHEQELEDYINSNKDQDSEKFKFQKLLIEGLIASHKAEQLGIKTDINSFYGAYANPYFRYYDIRCATAITLAGQLAIRWISNYIETNLNEYSLSVKYMDTDSSYVDFEVFANKIISQTPSLKLPENRNKLIDKCDKFIELIVMPIINKGYEELQHFVNAPTNRMKMAREIISINGVAWVAKKKYFMLVADSEGVRYDHDKFKAKGISYVQRSTPDVCKKPMKKALKMMLGDHDKLIDYIQEFKSEFFNLPAHKIGQTKTVNNIPKYMSELFPFYIGGTPAHVRGAINYNRFIKKHNLIGEYEEILSGESAKTIYMKMPNPIASEENIMAFLGDRWPDVNDISNYIDYATQFEKTFFKTIHDIANRVGIQLELDAPVNIDDLKW